MKKVLVTYFSATKITENYAKKIQTFTNGDIYEIKPKNPYSEQDLNWMDKQSRSSIEMSDKNSRPEIEVEYVPTQEYDIIFVGFPIWWYQAPTIINTFLESYNFDNKTVVPFATSGGSPMGKTNQYLASSIPNSTLLEGKVVNKLTDVKLKEWLESIINN